MSDVATVKYEGRVPKTLRAFCDRHSDAIAEVDYSGGFSFENRDGMGYDVLLRPGYCVTFYGDTMHTIVEPTVANVIAVLRTIEACHEDAECRAAWGDK